MLTPYYIFIFCLFCVTAIDFEPLEKLAYKHENDKAHDRYNFVDTYESYFKGIRSNVRNVTEIGRKSSLHASLLMWGEYFHKADIYGLGSNLIDKTTKHGQIHFVKCEVFDNSSISGIGIPPESMDIVIDSMHHSRAHQEKLLLAMWPRVKPGGYYIIEYLHPETGGLDYGLNPDLLSSHTLGVIQQNLVAIVYTHLGHRRFDYMKRLTAAVPSTAWTSHRVHGAYLLIIRKRVGPVPPVLIHCGVFAYHRAEKASLVDVDNPTNKPEFLEYLGYKYGTDKSRDDHKYVNTYAPLFDPIRQQVLNVTEVGVAYGASMQMWHDYFPHATIHGFDTYWRGYIAANLDLLPRVRRYNVDCYQDKAIAQANFALESMDIIVDDAHHERVWMDKLLKIWWPVLKPGGFYVIEDCYPHGNSGNIDFEENPDVLPEFTREVFRDNHVMYVDAWVGTRSYDELKKRNDRIEGKDVVIKDRRNHYSYLIIIRKRIGPVPPLPVA